MQTRHRTRQVHFEASPPSRFEWWFQRTSISLPDGGTTNFMARELVRRSRLMSIIVFFLILIVTLILPATFFIPNHWTRFFCWGLRVCVFWRSGSIERERSL